MRCAAISPGPLVTEAFNCVSSCLITLRAGVLVGSGLRKVAGRVSADRLPAEIRSAAARPPPLGWSSRSAMQGRRDVISIGVSSAS